MAGVPDDVLPLFVAELDYPLAEPIRDALFEAVRRSDTGYAASAEPLAEAFAAFAARRWGWPVDPRQVVVTNEVGSAVVEVLRMILEPGDEVVITPPVYPAFFDLVPAAGGRVVDVLLLHGQTGWTLDLDDLEAALRDGGLRLDGVLAALEANRGLLAGLLDAHLGGVGYEQPRAGYLAWLDLRSLGWGDDPAAVALERAKVALLPGLLFGTPGAGFARLNFGCSPEVLSEAVSRIAALT
ncbi:aminotransferase class I/II-fold pyridoxal phosphate-dependent enzyme [Cryobacterium sp. GrIS_2_6]|uniref:aminotransferase class I/II-fold pyridoxal phosphate-dependent enzyme n=1 Tax=Cryobacterium sp. GrIS_2_6 TaxID=3162785 RepID=UPI002DFF9B3C|nr:aminotransferase class I/II-fold pyridoxal phosphate-dependent enzyme [Cryobacterium psychrotolerans]MEC5152283.1 bifunctional pyridoxal-dependent enzyme with beta-cystathionase and maltose regulon repressor activities [Cryobacterium psychrotolerans]